MRFRVLFALGLIVWLFNPTPWHSTRSDRKIREPAFYEKVPDGSCRDIPGSVFSVNPKYTFEKPLDQGNTGTCYAHATYGLLSEHYRRTIDSTDAAPFSLIEVLGRGCNGRMQFNGGGVPSVLQRIKNESNFHLSIGNNLPIEEVEKIECQYRSKDRLGQDDLICFCKQVSDLTGVEGLFSQLNEETKQILSENKEIRTYNAIQLAEANRARSRYPQEIEIPPYNVHLHAFQPGPHFQESLNSLAQHIEKHFSPPFDSRGPSSIQLSYCTEGPPGICERGHAVLITGIKEVMCSGEAQPRLSLNILNSWGDQGSGWHFADTFLGNALEQWPVQIVSLKPCTKVSEAPVSGKDRCVGHVMAADPVSIAVELEDMIALESLAADENTKQQFTKEAKKHPLILAVDKGKPRIARGLLQSFLGQAEIINHHRLVHKVADILARKRLGFLATERSTPDRYFEVRENFLETLDALVTAAGVNLDIKDDKGRPAISVALAYGAPKTVEYLINRLLQLGLRPPETDRPLENSRTLMQLLQERRDIDSSLLAKLAEYEAHYYEFLNRVKVQRPSQVVAWMKSEKISPEVLNRVDDQGNSALHVAVKEGKDELATELIGNLGVNLNPVNQRGESPLSLAFERRDLMLASLMISRGASLSSVDGRVSLQDVLTNKTVANRHLIGSMMNREGLHLRDKDGRTLLHYAVQNNHLELVRQMLEAGADVHIADNQGETPLHWAAGVGLPLTKTLIAAGAQINVQNKIGETPLIVSVRNGGRKDVALYLLEQGADPTLTRSVADMEVTASWYTEDHSKFRKILLAAEAKWLKSHPSPENPNAVKSKDSKKPGFLQSLFGKKKKNTPSPVE